MKHFFTHLTEPYLIQHNLFFTYVKFHAALLRAEMQTNAQGESLVNSNDYTNSSSHFYTKYQVGSLYGERFSSVVPINEKYILNHITNKSLSFTVTSEK